MLINNFIYKFTVTMKVITLNNFNLMAYSILKNTLLIEKGFQFQLVA